MIDLDMADTAVYFLLSQIESWLLEELALDEKIRTGITGLRNELRSIHALLRAADANEEHDHQVRTWLQQVQEHAYDIEHVLELSAYSNAQKKFQWFNILPDSRHLISNFIDEINNNLKLLSEARQRYHNIFSPHASGSRATTGGNTSIGPRIAPLFAEDIDIVGIEGSKDMLTSWALEGKERYKVMFVVGMGGSGKTTLVKKAFDRVKERFDCYAWITASKSSNKIDLLWSLFNEFAIPVTETFPQRSPLAIEVNMMNRLHHYLRGKRYVVVLDDLWTKVVWESVSHAFPKSNLGRVIITTRRGDIAYSCRDNSTDIHKIQPLPIEHARKLFYSRAFSASGTCPKQLEEWADKILNLCEGLPLGIIEVGQFLSNKERIDEWRMLHDSFSSQMTRGDISNIMKVLFMSYSDLPYRLKYCFLYLSIFPEGYSVKRRRLVRLWIAEGFIRAETGKQLEDIGEDYLQELIERSLVEVSVLDFDGKPISCRVHNIMHNIILSKSKDDNFLTVYKDSSGHLDEKSRRISIQNSNEYKLNKQNSTHARTLFVFGGPCINLSNVKLLKVLHLEGAAFDTFPDEIAELLLLRYLCLSNTRISRVPKSLGELQYLETLDLKQTRVTKLPKVVSKLDNLRHLLVCNYNIGSYVSFDCVKGFTGSTEIGNLKNLQKLSFLKLNSSHDHDMLLALGNLTQLRKLGIIDLRKEHGRYLCSAIQKMKLLQSLNLTSTETEEILDLQHKITDPPILRRLYLKGRLERLPVWISRLHDLVRIRLKWSKLQPKNSPIEILQDLPNLLELQLLDAYAGYQLDFFAGKFQKLKILELEQLARLKTFVMYSGSLPCLQKIIIRRCSMLVQLPHSIEYLTHLKELILCDMPSDFVNKLKNGGVLRHLIRQIPHVHAYYVDRNGQMHPECLS